LSPITPETERLRDLWKQKEFTKNPELAAKVAECIAAWADIETMLGMLLGFLLNADSKVALAMYAEVEPYRLQANQKSKVSRR